MDMGAWSSTQKLAAFAGACVITLDGLDIQILSFAVPQIARDWHIAKSSFALVFAISLIAISIGTIVGGWLGDTFGRRKSIILAVMWFGIFTMFLATSRSMTMLFFYRLISGLGIGAALPNATAYVAEVTPARARTAVISSSIVCVPLGGFVGGLIAAHVLPMAGWRTLVAIAGMLPIGVACLLFALLPESPRFVAARFRREDAVRVLAVFGLTVEPGVTILSERTDTAEQADSIGALLAPRYRRDTLALWSAFGFCLISVYLVFNWLPSLLSNLGLNAAAASTGLATYNLFGIFGTLLLGLWMNRRGSRGPLVVAGLGSIVSALWLAVHLAPSPTGNTTLSMQIGAHGFFVNGVQSALYAIAAHLYPTRLRSRGVAAASAFGRMGAVLSAFVGGRALHYRGPVFFWILALTLSGTVISLQFLRNHIAGVREAS